MSRPDFVTCDRCRTVIRRRKTYAYLFGDTFLCLDEDRCHERAAGEYPRKQRHELDLIRRLDARERAAERQASA